MGAFGCYSKAFVFLSIQVAQIPTIRGLMCNFVKFGIALRYYKKSIAF